MRALLESPGDELDLEARGKWDEWRAGRKDGANPPGHPRQV